MTFRSLVHLLREWTWTHRRQLPQLPAGYYTQHHRSRDAEPFPGHDTQVDVWERPVDRATRTTEKGYTVRRLSLIHI